MAETEIRSRAALGEAPRQPGEHRRRQRMGDRLEEAVAAMDVAERLDIQGHLGGVSSLSRQPDGSRRLATAL